MFKKKKNKEKENEVVEIKEDTSTTEEKENKTQAEGKTLARGKKLPSDVDIDVYKWLKIIQAIILCVLGVILIVTSSLTNSEGENQAITQNALGYAIGSVLTVYGLINVLAGYLLFRTPFGQEIPAGVLAICFAIVFFFKPDLIDTMLPYLIMTALISYFVIMIIYGLDLLLWKEKKHVAGSVLSFIIGAIFLAISITYIILWNKSETREKIEKWVTIVVGVVFIVLGIFSLVNTLRKIKNTKMALKENEEVKASETSDANKNKLKVFRKHNNTSEDEENKSDDNTNVIEASYETKAIENGNDDNLQEDDNESK